MPSYCVKALENTQSILCGLFLVCEHFCSGRTASHRTALDFRGIFVLLDAGGLSPAKEKRAKSTEKTGCPTCVLLLIDATIDLLLPYAGRAESAGEPRKERRGERCNAGGLPRERERRAAERAEQRTKRPRSARSEHAAENEKRPYCELLRPKPFTGPARSAPGRPWGQA